MSQEHINILIEFNDTISIQQFNYQSQPQDFFELTMPIQILSSALLKETLFVITIDGNLTAYFFNHGKLAYLLYLIIHLNIYTLIQQIIQTSQLLIIKLIQLSYRIMEYQSFEILNNIHIQLLITIKSRQVYYKNGIYMAFVQQNNNQLYFYPIQNVYISNSLQIYYQVDLLGYQFQTGQIISSYTVAEICLRIDNYKQLYFASNIIFHHQICTPKHIYLILQDQYGIFCAYFSGSDSPFNSFVYSNALFANSQNVLIIILMSVVQKQKQNIELVQIFINQSLAVNGSVLYGEFQIMPYFLETNYSYMTTLQKKVNILFQRQLITQKQFNLESQELIIQNNTKLIINPSNLFNGNIKNYSINYRACKSFNFTQPINGLTSQTLNFSFQAAIKNNNMIFIQNNISLYQLNEQTGFYS
ncbi:unnamed protein product [Paramecium pentaurelia]|uniref:Uncharacterized protein n=1 Tax=Paramecium pentaurelia TaxID=43138 RepID=A0A8S1XK19_9CILI|nr:unnamed protein product [Paramecium pentaurelia]